MTPTGGRGRGSEGRPPSDLPAGARPSEAAAGASPGSSAPGAMNQMTIASDYGAAREVQRLIREDVERWGYDPDSQFAIKLAIEEALINAIKHGNKLDRAKRVHVEWRVGPDSAEFSVEDEGPGFQRTHVPDPTDETNLEKLTGRGILLMEAYMNQVEWSREGRRVRLVKHNERQTAPTPAPGVKSA